MSEHAVTIKIVAAGIGRLRQFRRQGGCLSDFLANVFRADDAAGVVGAKLLAYFCVDENGRFNGFMPGIELAVAFLRKTLGGPTEHDEEVQALKDLREILGQTPTHQELLRWVQAHYG